MSEEQQQVSTEEQGEQARASFAAGYNKVRGEEPSTEVIATNEQETPTAEAQDDTPATDDSGTEADKPVFAGLTESELKAKLAKIDEIDQLNTRFDGETRKVYSKVGELNRTIQQLQEIQKHPGSFSTEAISKLRSEGYEELADILSVGNVAPDGASKPEDVEKLVSERVQAAINETTERLEEKLISIQHKDWKEIPKTEEFKVWFGSLPKERAEALWNSREGDHVASEFTEFKAWRETYRKQQADAQEAERQKQDKQARLEAAATPTNRTAPPISEPNVNDRFRAGYNKVAGGRKF